jgi:hypothetical protein
MLRPAQIQPFSPQQQRFSVFDGKRHGIPAAVVQCFDGVFAQFQEEAGPVGHLADHCESFPRGLEVVQRTYALCAEDAFVPGLMFVRLVLGSDTAGPVEGWRFFGATYQARERERCETANFRW